MPLSFQDHTAGHFNDIGILSKFMDLASGVTDPLKGQEGKTHISATEMRAVIQGGASRLVTYCLLAWEQALGPMGSRMLTNHRQNVDWETYSGIVGDEADQETFAAFKAQAIALIGKSDLFVFDGVLPSEKAFMAQSLQELLVVALQTPEVAIREGWDLTKILKEIFWIVKKLP